jgi:hypothetical protein
VPTYQLAEIVVEEWIDGHPTSTCPSMRRAAAVAEPHMPPDNQRNPITTPESDAACNPHFMVSVADIFVVEYFALLGLKVTNSRPTMHFVPKQRFI